MKFKNLLSLILIGLSLNLINAVAQELIKFSYPRELAQIQRHASRLNVEPELLMAIREAEDGNKYPYGIIPRGLSKQVYNKDRGYFYNSKFYNYKDKTEKNMSWCANTVYKKLLEFDAMPFEKRLGYLDFIDFLGDSYAPKIASNDPTKKNKNWERNVRDLYLHFIREK